MAHTTTGKKQLLARVRRIRGQAEALERALDEDAGCLAVLQQIAAVRGAVHGLMAVVLEGHLREHLGRGDAAGTGPRDEDLEAVVAALRAYLR
ncbi:MAG: metal/formaldehyde-sensitive transcriptional repressor [Xylophilus ampelinus]